MDPRPLRAGEGATEARARSIERLVAALLDKPAAPRMSSTRGSRTDDGGTRDSDPSDVRRTPRLRTSTDER